MDTTTNKGFKHNPKDAGLYQETSYSLLKIFKRFKQRYVAMLAPTLLGYLVLFFAGVPIILGFILKHPQYTGLGAIIIIVGLFIVALMFQIGDPATRRLAIGTVYSMYKLDRYVKKNGSNEKEVEFAHPHARDDMAYESPKKRVGYMYEVVGKIDANSYQDTKAAYVASVQSYLDGIRDKGLFDTTIRTITTSGRMSFQSQINEMNQLIKYAREKGYKDREQYVRAEKERLLDLDQQGVIVSYQYVVIEANTLHEAQEVKVLIETAFDSGMASQSRQLTGKEACKVLERSLSV